VSADLAAYFARVGFAGEAKPDLATLRRLHELHAQSIPFENLAAFLGEPISLEIPALEEKLLRRGRGGWCFEHNLYFAAVLKAIGFEVKTLAARVRWNVPPHMATARSHMLMLVTIAGRRHIADVGFGGLSLTTPLALEVGIAQATPHETFRLAGAGEGYVLEVRLGEDWHSLYMFDLHEQQLADYEVSNWYLAHYPQSQFVNGVIAARAAPDRRHALRNTRYAIHYPDGETERRVVADVGELREILEGAMGIRLPDAAGLDDRLDRMIQANRG
jgi:N-hydroxyarylamine O-acetyltransferase